MKPLKLFAVIAINDEGRSYLVGLKNPDVGNFPIVSRNRELVEIAFNVIDEKTKSTARIVEFNSIDHFDEQNGWVKKSDD